MLDVGLDIDFTEYVHTFILLPLLLVVYNVMYNDYDFGACTRLLVRMIVLECVFVCVENVYQNHVMHS